MSRYTAHEVPHIHEVCLYAAIPLRYRVRATWILPRLVAHAEVIVGLPRLPHLGAGVMKVGQQQQGLPPRRQMRDDVVLVHHPEPPRHPQAPEVGEVLVPQPRLPEGVAPNVLALQHQGDLQRTKRC
eukprot:CAMPEP_0173402878 /NCGR_PEP_ID=MMETSP1356-20130122/55212_1 /TAXON_ID=77927 ORGANISM="Hemiselmis virescens, Strain PCC157" /NCGR_SAMPLE_ID=MMETSP1356 /ASSEMBLY_ACC=CAM_ASM_000847 /LENGTH=126 /DNA_ID=CAMNT_0014363297 /DNA_START=74 /DNA_END=454 /DNA_ORIENTATION=-